MIIAVNTKYFLRAYQQDYLKFIYECFRRITAEQPQHSFIFIADAPFDASFAFYKNCIPVVIEPGFSAGFSGLLYEKKIYSLLKKYKADVYLHAGSFISLFIKVSTCFYLPRPDYLSRKNFVKKNQLHVYKKMIPFFLKRSQTITESLFSKNYIIQQYNIDPQKIEIIYNGTDDVCDVVTPEEKEKMKDLYAGGHEYFVFIGNKSPQNILLNVLKGFSHFKKWQKSGMQLLIVLNDKADDEFINSLSLFKYKSEVKLLTDTSPQELTKVINAAYCMIYFSGNEVSIGVALQAVKNSVPVVTGNTGLMVELCDDAVLYTDFDDAANIAEKITNLYKDENLRQELIEKGRQKMAEYSWDKASGLLWNSLLNTNG